MTSRERERRRREGKGSGGRGTRRGRGIRHLQDVSNFYCSFPHLIILPNVELSQDLQLDQKICT